MRAAVLVDPPAELSASLTALARSTARELRETRAVRPRAAWLSLPATWLAWLQRPRLAFAQVAAALVISLAGWQLLGWLQAAGSVVGDVPFALQLLFSSPAALYLPGIQIDLPSMVLWSAIGGAAWLVSESGPLHHFVVTREPL